MVYSPKDVYGNLRTPYAVWCDNDCAQKGGTLVYLTLEQYNRQMAHPSAFWKCPVCRHNADWDDDNYEDFLNI